MNIFNKKETWETIPTDNYIIFDDEGDSKNSLGMQIKDGQLIIAVYNGNKWVVQIKKPLTDINLFKLKRLIEKR